MTQPQRVESLSHAQRERLAYIDCRLYFFDEIGRPDLIEHFGMAATWTTRDLALYREIAPQNVTFDGINKIYHIGQVFSPLFDHASLYGVENAKLAAGYQAPAAKTSRKG